MKQQKFKKWVCSEALSINQETRAYITEGKTIESFGLIDNDEAEALRRVDNPNGKTKLHYEVVNYITKYPHAITTPSLSENEITQISRLDSMNEGYRKGQPDLELQCKDCD